MQVTLRLFPPHNRDYDVDNRIKPSLDALTKTGFWLDDRYVRKIVAVDCEPVVGGAVVALVEPFDDSAEREIVNALLCRFGLKRLNENKKTKGISHK